MPSTRVCFQRNWLRAVLLGLLAIGLAGCATVKVTGPSTAGHTYSPAFAQARDLASKESTLPADQRAANARAIDKLLAGLDDATLSADAAALPAGDPLYQYAGHALQRRGLPLPRPFDRGAWRFDAGNRPPAEGDGYRPPVKLAVLLPLSGSLAPAAAPVRDGFLTGYYGESRRRPEITFYDTAMVGAAAAYAKAVAEGNDFVVGPLGREEVSAVFRGAQGTVPMLALNRASVPPPAGNASFSLSPEDDGIAAAEYLRARKAVRVLVITGVDEGLHRAASALRDALAERGGTVVESLDMGGDAASLLARLQASVQKAGQVDAVFLATRASEARTIAPLLASAGLAGKPLVATSALASGTGKPAEDMVLDGIAYPTEPWTVRGVSGLPSAASVASQLKTARGPAARLFAFGYDAWLITAYLEKLALDPNGSVQGATGTLRLDPVGNILHTPTWSTFRGGMQVPLADAAAR
ncbi:LppC superfamily protein [Lysobacter dokdonensis DS-58]|uniref:LppC superfamily protein n=1 Tax=Lysobacter dokdonensis DS-58 TaxID=1300345 RepID=A0A0A2WGG0_9GAMM|nr:penicillin-binding protein activator [Lysobacter dokdonensis]KGQ18883.1 LppC superfamily protein [Lysobacter dokdonensis DS-58]